MALVLTDNVIGIMETATTYNIPSTVAQRTLIRNAARAFMAARGIVPPITEEQLSDLALRFINEKGVDPSFKGWIMVELNNCLWRDTIASIPFERRILLIPQCLKNATQCSAEIDDLGLLCKQCNQCTISGMQQRAFKLGTMSLVAEGFTPAISLVESQVVDAVIGIGCMDSLERAFPMLIKHAVAGIAIPLNGAGCSNTDVDLAHVQEIISTYTPTQTPILDYEHLKTTIQSWFDPKSTKALNGSVGDHASEIARNWLFVDGKRWRPYLLAATYMAVTAQNEIPNAVMQAALAVECFHKASLVHDDIQDNDQLRYGKQTVYSAHGVPIAINVGDLLLGEGYRLLAGCGNMELIKAASEAHVALCKGQGMELEWSAAPRMLSMDQVLEIFCFKTVPAFEVALMFGIICANQEETYSDVLKKYSHALGIAYQLQDDLDDFATDAPLALRPSAVLATLCEMVDSDKLIDSLKDCNDIQLVVRTPEYAPALQNSLEKVKQLSMDYTRQAFDALSEIHNVELKRLLFRVTRQILK